MRVNFFGACREVTGSNILIEAGGKKILFDCGLFQGSKSAEERNYAPFPYNAREIDFVIICHAHLDHTGRLPKLAKEGFLGKIFSTGPTKELTGLVLSDSEKLMREESERDDHPPLFGIDDVERVMNLFETLTYGENVEISPGIRLTFKNAGHILGSCVCLLEADGTKLAYTSDLGNKPSLLLAGPEYIENAAYVICESTYGGRIHEDVSTRTKKLSSVISSTIVTNGVLLIPAFAIERTQELLHDIDHFCSVEGCDKPTFYLDSPLAQKVTGVFGKYPEYLSDNIRKGHTDGDFFGLERLKITQSVEESKHIQDLPNPKIIIAGSGMMNGGRILHHLRRYIEDENSAILIVGYQAQGTLGRRIFDGEKNVKVFGEPKQVNAKVLTIGSYSAPADMPQLIDWLSHVKGMKKVFLVHGENNESLALSGEISRTLKVETVIPQIGESYEL